ncbi:CapA family protein [Actinomadura kijaniata]|uniref:Poly-gamma-glutamate synthesis protein (Capsule biosynthesis protein) n=1 Tax=Actinomadura namibiensis TaxID=182080 RepID=A0A7W3LM41_ACTNM|nr:CapA family protein [Actinomadura namibiensis]MBA8950686.1 poly-gamma-glutamate synthesis protein (capsule biosynthesis protein) [Actinomadura namibiensis]
MGFGRHTGRFTALGAGMALVAASLVGCGEGVGPKAEGKPFTVAFGGDVHFAGSLANRLAASPDTALGPIAEHLKPADLAMVNLETAVTDGGTPAPKQYVFRAPSAAFRALRSAGVDVATMANNHGMDYGETGLRDSLDAARRSGFPVVGIGGNAAEAYRPHVVTVKGNKVAIIGATQVLDDHLITQWTATDAKAGLASAKDAPRLVQEVRAARQKADFVIVNLHWGQELNQCPTPVQRQLAAQLADAGADAVVGSHAHVLQAGGWLKGRYVHYGLGNFVFYNSGPRTGRTGVLTLTFDPKGRPSRVSRADWTPAHINGGVPQPLSAAEAQQARAQWEGLRSCADVTAAPA